MYKKYFKHEKGITGLETAIILIAFVVVAAVFAYTVLSAGLFATGKAQESVYSGLREAQSTLELKGSPIATAQVVGALGTIKQISFIVSPILGGEPMDFTAPSANLTSNNGLASTNSTNRVVVNYSDSNQRVYDLFWTCTQLGTTNGDNLLEPGERFQITIGSNTTGSFGGNMIDALNPDLSTSMKFNLELVTPAGAVLILERTTPIFINQKIDLR
jgi:flagellin FlaB